MLSPVEDGQEFHSIMTLTLQNRLEHCTQQVRKFHVKLRNEEAQRLEQEKTAKKMKRLRRKSKGKSSVSSTNMFSLFTC